MALKRKVAETAVVMATNTSPTLEPTTAAAANAAAAAHCQRRRTRHQSAPTQCTGAADDQAVSSSLLTIVSRFGRTPSLCSTRSITPSKGPLWAGSWMFNLRSVSSMRVDDGNRRAWRRCTWRTSIPFVSFATCLQPRMASCEVRRMASPRRLAASFGDAIRIRT